MTKTDYNVGDINSKAKGTGARANSGKISFAITPLPLLAGCARVWMYGLLKYAPWNWAKGMKWSVPFDCLCRHLFKWWYLGEDIDSESGEHHLDLVMCNLFMLKHYTKTFTEGDDRPPEYADFACWLEDFNTPFDEAAFLERNPDIAELVEAKKAKEAGDISREEIEDIILSEYSKAISKPGTNEDLVEHAKVWNAKLKEAKAEQSKPKERIEFIRGAYNAACDAKRDAGLTSFTQDEIVAIWIEAGEQYDAQFAEEVE
jgi:hypothetical protein